MQRKYIYGAYIEDKSCLNFTDDLKQRLAYL